MGPINWLAVIISAVLATVLSALWYGPLFGAAPQFGIGQRAARRRPLREAVAVFVLFGASALMIGHSLARIDAAHLVEKPALFWMQTGGVAAFFVLPALWAGCFRRGHAVRHALIDSGYWITAYLAMGTVFWALS